VTEEKAVTTLLVQLLSSNGSPRPIKGNQLSVVVRTHFPDFDPEKFQCRNLREFIRKYAADDVMEIGRAGMDIVYSLRSVGQQQPLFEPAVADTTKPSDQNTPLGQLLANPRIWKTFASPDTAFRLFLAPSTKQVTVLRPGYIPDSSWVEVPHISAEALLQIAKDFISDLPEFQRAPLTAALDQPRWWIGFYDLIRTLGLKMRWIYFRRRRIAQEFERAMPALPTDLTPTVQPQPTPQEARKPELVIQSMAVQSSALPVSPLQRVAADVVQRMTDSELRALNLPLGYVVDALTTR
jgi:hypothetical protein